MNGVAECINRTLMDLVRSMLTSAKLPPSFWAEAMSAAVYVKNRMIHANLEDGVLEGIWNGKPPSVKHLKAYGCLAYAHLPHQGRKELNSRASACVLVGYSSQTKGYRLCDIRKREIIQTKHVRFDETKLGYEQEEDIASQVLFNFPYNEPPEKERESDDTQANIQQRSNKKSKKGYARTEPIQTRSRSTAQRMTKESDEESSNEYDEETDVKNKKIVGASSKEYEKQTSNESKREIRNPYSCKGKPKDKVELHFTNKGITKSRSVFITPVRRVDTSSGGRVKQLKTIKNLGNR